MAGPAHLHEETGQITPAAPRSRRRIGWAIIGIAAAVVAGSFLIPDGDDAEAERGRGEGANVVAAAPVTRGSITERARYPGELDADAVDVSSFYAGRVVAVKVRVGDSVGAVAVVAELDPVDAREQLARARAQAQAAAAEEKKATIEGEAAAAELARIEPGKDELISASELDALRAKAQALRTAVGSAAARRAEAVAGIRLLERRLVESVVRAPFAGRIGERYVDPGAIVQAGTPLVRVVAVAPLRVRFRVPEQEIADLTVGRALRVETAAGGPGDVPAVISGAASEVDRKQRVATVEAVIESPPAGWLSGMFAEVVVDRRTLADALIVPAPALLSRLQPDGSLLHGVFVADAGVARWSTVKVTAEKP